jgi:uncharacterized FlaG/YvyC family protein
MSENTITAIQPIRITGSSSYYAGVTTSVVSETPLPQTEVVVKKEPEPVKTDSETSIEAHNTSLRFQIDEQKMTIYIIDRASKEVLRSIPASEMHKLNAGDLIKLTA